jgi:hypothetical protein
VGELVYRLAAKALLRKSFDKTFLLPYQQYSHHEEQIRSLTPFNRQWFRDGCTRFLTYTGTSPPRNDHLP